MSSIYCSLVLLLFAVSIKGDEVNRGGRKGVMVKLLREMVNQTKADTLNLPANATSIRENITDTFSCENRTYGYYADVDNECQVFHVCLTSQSTRGRNVTYRWSFICPNETIFNQEVLTCTRPRDSIDCEESPMYYHLNMDIGKVPNDTQEMPSKDVEEGPRMKQRRPIRKQNIIMENILNEAKKEVVNLQVYDLENVEEGSELIPVIEVEDIEKYGEYQEVSEEMEDETKVHLNNNNKIPDSAGMKEMEKPEIYVENKSQGMNKDTKKNGLSQVNRSKERNNEVTQVNVENNQQNKKAVDMYGERFDYKTNKQVNAKNNLQNKGVEKYGERFEIQEVNAEYKMKGKRMDNSRLSTERSMRNLRGSRGSFRFKADV